jgi:hypothetical protein
MTMSSVEEIEKAVAELPADELARFRAWFEESRRRVSMSGSSATPKQANSTNSPSRHLQISAPAARGNLSAWIRPI